MASVFLSYAREDAAKAKTLAEALEKAGHDVWWDRHIRSGSEFSGEIQTALNSAQVVLVLWSRASVGSEWVRDEATEGRDSGRLLPVALDASKAPLGFRQRQSIDMADWNGRGPPQNIDRLLHALDANTAIGAPNAADRSSFAEPLRRRGPTRRTVVAGLVAAGTTGAVGYLLLRDRQAPVPPEVAALMAQAWQAWAQGTSEGNSQAVGLYRRAISLAPNHADAWGFLGCAYGDRAHWSTAAERSVLRERAREAGRRALELDPKNAYGRAAIAYAQPIMGNWLPMERAFRRGLHDQPGKWLISYSLALLLTRVGRVSEAATLFGKLRGKEPTATQYFFHIQALWAAGKLDEADQLLEEATSIYETHPDIWRTRFDILLHGGRGSAAIALAQDEGSRPATMSEESLNALLSAARAMLSRDPAQIDSVMATELLRAHQSAGRAERAIQNASALGRVDAAFAIADAYYFSRGFVVPDSMPSADQPAEVSLDTRDTRFLFLPTVRAMRADKRFERLVDDLGLATYWRQAGSPPDYRQS
jgi:tetratricopeptide (TPR) repeat protein